MNEEDLDKRLKAYYANKTLSNDSISKLKNVIEQADVTYPESPVGKANRLYMFFERLGLTSFPQVATMVTCFLIVVSFMAWQNLSQSNLSSTIVQSSVIKEVTMNHKKMLVPDFKGIEVNALGGLMTNLDFSPVLPEIAKILNLEFIGARYCSISGNLAVQLKFLTPSGDICTLYQTKSTGDLLDLKETLVKSDDIKIKFWHENNLFMAIAGLPNGQ